MRANRQRRKNKHNRCHRDYASNPKGCLFLSWLTEIASGRLVEPGIAAIAMSIGADLIASARGPLMSLGCIQARECHSNHCPSGITTHNSWRLRGLDPTLKSIRYASYIRKYRSTLMKLARSAGVNIAEGDKFARRNLWAAQDKF